jgi:hypothetical protein
VTKAEESDQLAAVFSTDNRRALSRQRLGQCLNYGESTKEMGPVPPDFTLEKLVGRQLNQISIGAYDVQFCFDCEHVISCQGRVIVEVNGNSTPVFQGGEPYWLDVAPLPRVVSRDVTAWKVEGSHEFSVTLTGGAKLRFQSTDCPYEEFIIRPEIIVV